MNNKTSITHLLFDVFGVLISEGHLISNGLMKLLPEEIDKKTVKQAYDACNIGDIDEAEFWQKIGMDEYADLRTRFLESFQLSPGFESFIPKLKQQYSLAILSNCPEGWAVDLSQRFGFSQWFSTILFSAQQHLKKPQLQFYQLALQQLDVAAEQVLFIDDRIENLQAAKKVGMQTLWFSQQGMLSDDLGIDGVCESMQSVYQWLTGKP